MKCKNCGAVVDLKDYFCFKCGSKLKEEKKPEKRNNLLPLTGILFSIFAIMIVGIFLYLNITSHNNSTVYLNDTIFEPKSNKDPALFSFYSTSIIYDNKYNYKTVKDLNDAQKYIINESKLQRKKCGNNIISTYENSMETNYQITAVNLCEFNSNYIKNIDKVFNKTFETFPNTKGYLTNVTLMNPSADDNFIASFKPMFQFINEKGNVKVFPWVIKTQMLLNSNYYLNNDYLNATINSNTGWFVNDADSYSIISHELGHYLSFVALLKKYNIASLALVNSENIDNVLKVNSELENGTFSESLLNEAYQNYQNKYGYISFNAFQKSISEYACNDVLDETIAEAYHDYYLHGDNATKASLEIINVLKEKLQ